MPLALSLSRPRTAIVVVVFFGLCARFAGLGESDQPIVFKHGQTIAYAQGEFSGKNREAYYSFYATKGQHLVVRIRPVTPALMTAGVVIYPSGKQDGGPGGITFDSDLTETGKYRIRVTQRQGEVSGKFRLSIKISPLKKAGVEFGG